MARSALILGAAASLGLGVVDIAYLNLRLVPTALSSSPPVVVAADEMGAVQPDAPSAPPTASLAAAKVEASTPRPEPVAALDPVDRAEPKQDDTTDALLAPEPSEQGEPAEPTPVPDLVTLHFDSDSDELSARSLRRIGRVARHLEGDAELRVVVTGHADERGSADYNDELARGRARRVASALASAGVDRARIEERSLGEARPLSSGRDPAALRANRRVEIVMERGQP